MRTLTSSDIKSVNGGALVTIGVIVGSFVAGYIYGKLTKEKPKPPPPKPCLPDDSRCV